MNEINCLKEQQKEVDERIDFFIEQEQMLKHENAVLKSHINSMSIELHKMFTMNHSVIESYSHRKKRNFNEI